jgi:hypothetical protein
MVHRSMISYVLLAFVCTYSAVQLRVRCVVSSLSRALRAQLYARDGGDAIPGEQRDALLVVRRDRQAGRHHRIRMYWWEADGPGTYHRPPLQRHTYTIVG